MSIIDSAVNTVVSYSSGITKPFAGQRLASFNWKTGTDKNSLWFGIKRESKAVSLQVIAASEIESNLPSLIPHVRNLLIQTQDKIIREMLEKSDSILHVSNSDISIASCIEFLDDSNESGRVTKLDVENWFDAEVSDNLMVSLAERLGVSEIPSANDSAKIEQMIAAFKSKVSSLAGGKTSYDPKVATQLLKAISLCKDENDSMKERFTVRLNKMINVVKDDLLDAL